MSDGLDVLRAAKLTSVRLSDDDAANRFIKLHGERVRYVAEWKLWLVWDGRRWQRDLGAVRVTQLARRVAKEVAVEAIDLDADSAKKMSAWARRLAGANGIRSMLEVARGEAGILVTPTMLDSDMSVLNCWNGIVDLKTGELKPHDPKQLCTKITRVEYDPSATAPAFLELVELVLGTDPDVFRFFRALLGLAVSGNPGERVVPLLYGTGRNGKSMLLWVLLKALGDYGSSADGEALLLAQPGNRGGPNEELADLMGRRLVVVSDLPQGQINASRIKQLSGGDAIRAHRKYEHVSEFPPTHTILIAANDRPSVPEHSTAVWDRLKLLPCDTEIEHPRPRAEVKAELAAQLPGVLAWLVRAAVDYLRDGLGEEPDVVKARTAVWRRDDDTFGQWLEDCTVDDPEAVTPSSWLYDDYKRWCGENRISDRDQLSVQRFARAMDDRKKYDTTKLGRGRRGRKGLRLQEAGGGLKGESHNSSGKKGFS